MKLFRQHCAVLCAGTALLLCCPALADTPPARRPPKLLVVLVVDQMRAEYIEKYQQQWSRGLLRLSKGGAWFREARYPYLNTVTCPGHATIGTGTFPATHGMVLNGWWEREAVRTVSCTDDPQAWLVSYGRETSGGHSPRRLLVPTLAEELRAQKGASSRVVALSLKARSAMMLAGQEADAVVWFESSNGAWLTSSAYTSTPVSWVKKFLDSDSADQDFGRVWMRGLRSKAYLYKDDAPGEKPPSAWNRYFPHRLRGLHRRPDAQFYRMWEMSPYSDAFLGRMAAHAVDALRLGQGAGTDFLGVSFSALDYAGHNFGPRSHEVQDILVRLDATIGDLLRHLDRAVGPENYVVALTADHGVASIPEQMSREGGDAGRVVTNDLMEEVEQALKPHLGPGRHVARMVFTDFYFTNGVYQKLLAHPPALDAVLAAIRSTPGVARVFRGEELRDRADRNDPLARAASLSYHPDRSGDLIVIPKPNWFFVNASNASPPGAAATHGTLHDYDSRVPVILMGAHIKPGIFLDAASPADIAPTLAFLAGVNLARAEGRVLSEALRPIAASSAGATFPPQE